MFDERIIAGVSVFVAVARAGGYAPAAQAAGLSRSGVGKAILRLEDRLGFRLLDRSNRALRLTDEGRRFYEEVVPVLERLARIVEPASSEDEGLRGRLRVSTDAAFGSYILLPRLGDFINRHPRLRLEVVVRDRIDDDLLAQGYDVAIRFGERPVAGLDRTLLFSSRIVTCASAGYVDANGVPATPGDLAAAGHRCIGLTDPQTGRPYNWHFTSREGEAREVDPAAAVVVNDAPALMAALRANLGLGRALDFMVVDELADGSLVEVLADWSKALWPAHIWTRAGQARSRALQAFVQFCEALVV